VDTIATAGGTAWIVGGDDYVVVGSPLTDDATDLPLRATFVPWLARAVAQQLGDDGEMWEATPGQQLTERAIAAATALEAPDGSTTALTSDRLTLPAAAGVYFLRRGDQRTTAIVVNAEAEESELATFDGDALARAVRAVVVGERVGVDAARDPFARAVFASAGGRSLLLPLAIAAVVVLLSEGWIGRARPRRVPDARVLAS
jgi:hypothetical protein